MATSPTPAQADIQPAADLLNATLIYREDLNPSLSIFRVKPDSGQVADFIPGQFAMLGLPRPEAPEDADKPAGRVKLVRRAYSIASASTVRDYLEFVIVVVEGGRFTPLLWNLKPGDRIFMDKLITGKFTLDPVPPNRNLVMVCTGTGLAPFMSMYRTYCEQPRWRRYIVMSGARKIVDLAYRDELERAARTDATMTYLPSVTREPPEAPWTGLRGRVPTFLEPARYAELIGEPLSPETTSLFLCGNPDMINDVEKLLAGYGFSTYSKKNPQGNIYFERYW